MNRQSKPKVILINPSIKDVFPTSRFALCVSSLAGYLRKNKKAEVLILDMQIGETVETIMREIKRLLPDIIGISISFGQMHIAESLLEKIFCDKEIIKLNPLVIAGNAISAFMCEELINMFPRLIVCNGEGELSISGLVDYVRGEIDLELVPGISYLEESEIKRTQTIEVDMDDLPLPAIDTVEDIIRNNGALTMEISRGCSHSACSFCPRSHKPAKWKGMSPINVLEQLEQYKMIFDKYKIERRIFMADEEFIGWMENGKEVKRINDIMRGMIERGLNIHFETNTRIDQIYDPQKEKKWHVERMEMIALCKEAGLDRLLVGVESGSDSVLIRFNKKIKKIDSVMAIRILTALSIGLRVTFITFDPLMNFQELKENVAFLERKDFYLTPVNISKFRYAELFDAIHDEDFVRANSLEVPFYRNITYMLVLLDVLWDCDYCRLIAEQEVNRCKVLFQNDRKPDINMARYKVRYVDETIGDIAFFCQKWIDRHFALDYCLKGMYKTMSGREREMIFAYRAKYRKISFNFLKSLVWIFDEENTMEVNDNIVDKSKLLKLRQRIGVIDRNDIIRSIGDLFNGKMQLLVDEIEKAIIGEEIRDDNGVLKRVIGNWREKKGWSLINP